MQTFEIALPMDSGHVLFALIAAPSKSAAISALGDLLEDNGMQNDRDFFEQEATAKVVTVTAE